MRTVRWLVAAGLLASATGCVETNGYPGTSYGGYPSGYGGYPSSGYYGQPAYSPGSGLLGSLFNQQPTYQAAQLLPAADLLPTADLLPAAAAGRDPAALCAGAGGEQRPAVAAAGTATTTASPDWKERDRNGDGVPDCQQRRATAPANRLYSGALQAKLASSSGLPEPE